MSNFIVPGKIFHGLGAFSQMICLSGKRAFIVTGKGAMFRSGYIEKAIFYLNNCNQMSVEVFEGVEVDPSIETVMRGVNIMMRYQPDLIIGLGGGGAIDAAKAMWVFYEHPDTRFEDITRPFTIKTLHKRAQFVAIPSTSVITETSCVSVITDQKSGIKYPLISYELCPDIAIIDGELCRSMPPHVTANTGLGALTHAIEAYVTSPTNVYVDCLAERAIIDIFEALPIVFENGNNLKVRQKMHDASCLAGISYCNTLFGGVHSLAYQIVGKFGVPYGRANAILLPAVIRFTEKSALQKYTKLMSLLKARNIGDVVTKIERLCHNLSVEQSFSEVGIERSDWFEHIQSMAQFAMRYECSVRNSNLVGLSLDDMMKILTESFYGKDW
ncbi:iron-containing alcohol dehydrogenase [Yersinia enterocolitica]|uniref:iron-containing alcohol dehydrogenase n=1 Tax=Yersinia enterocolitica TaxID=630 RepID=UPI0029BEC3DF|nr:iron-containing alcohol dehydrogenase [Yersinia enterocolitica]HEI6777221.1 iron-containing alcohol dehydrogenase [Yersinia enterocolitica]HEI6781478.1 iron-containing alcohol dehydrogenase [Yersinia enterocolitica]HEI6785751.1 iron-containing alcohol dehydrogenase [Yersinia enterocolitica]HEI6840749.1 iron-containing alcohol dehydrogenase [Yersinia enterocolitica]